MIFCVNSSLSGYRELSQLTVRHLLLSSLLQFYRAGWDQWKGRCGGPTGALH